MSRCGQEVGSAGLQEKFVPPSGTSACTVVQQYETVVSVRERLLRRVVTHQKALSQVKLRPKREGSVGGGGTRLLIAALSWCCLHTGTILPPAWKLFNKGWD